MASLRHLHIYERIKKSKDSKTYGGTYRCVHPDCSHYSQHIKLAGKRAMCPCGQPFIIDPSFHFHRSKLVCINCTDSARKNKSRLDVASNLMDAIMNPLPSLVQAEVKTVLHEPEPEPKEVELPFDDSEQEDLEFASMEDERE